MKKIVLLTLLLLCTMHSFAQTEGISYQAVILNPNAKEIPGVNAQETILVNSQVAIKFTIIDDLGNIEYEEYHRTSTDTYGMINLLIGAGSPTGSAIFRDVFWDGYSKTLKVGIDFSGNGSNYTALGEQKLSYMPQPTNPDIVAAIEDNTNAVAAIAATISASGDSIDPVTAENTLAIAEEKTRAELAESINANAIALNTAKAGLSSAQETVLSNTFGSNSGDQDISGIATNVTAIALNTAKTGITSGQVNAITANTAKVGVPAAYTLPNTDGTSSQVLATDGNGDVSWTTPSAGVSSTFDTTNNVTANSNGTIATDDFVFGSTALDDISGTADDKRFFFDKSKGAFRAGLAAVTQWDDANIGSSSFAAGANTVANGITSTAMGDNTTASAYTSTAMGYNTTASGITSTAMGFTTTASGSVSMAMGSGTTAKSYAETTIGMNNTDYTPVFAAAINSADRLFVIGNGTTSHNKSDALVMLKNGNTTLKGQLTLTDGSSSYTLPNIDGTPNQVLSTDGSGAVSWATAASGGASNINDLTDGKADSNGSSLFLGKDAGTNDDGTNNQNVGIGYNALLNNTTGYGNTAYGYIALKANTTGGENTAIGKEALSKNTTGTENSAMGKEALGRNTTGYRNTANGKASLVFNTTGRENSANGHSALYLNSSGNKNTANGQSALNRNTTGDNNTGIGQYALHINTTGNNNTGIGFNAQVPSGTSSNQVRIGDTNVSYAGIQVPWTVTSDRTWKEGIRTLPYGLDLVMQLKPVDYLRKNNTNKTREIGFIAQDVEALLTKVGYTDQGLLTSDDDGHLSLRYNDFISLLTKAIQEQQLEKEQQDIKIAALEKQNLILLELVQRVEDLEKK